MVQVIMGLNRRQLLRAAAALPTAAQLRAQSAPQFHLRAGLVAYSYRKELAAKSLNYADLISMIADWGLDGLDCTVYWFPDTSNEFLTSIRKAAFRNGIQIYNAGVRVQLCQPTRELQLSQYENIKKWVDVADRLGASHMRVFGGQIPKGATEQEAIVWAVEVLKRGAEYAGSRGITLGVEDDGGLTTAAGPTVEIVKQAASPWAGINADSGNLRVDGYSQFATMLPYATSVHLKGSIAGEDGKKEDADWKRLITMIGKSGYRGYVGLEYEDNDAAKEVPRKAANLRALLRMLSA
ncbi:MAG TPA: sugar phosphate isomerase/epimerase family protein [Bryobacteraceae bacterium]|jgi:sugar phosphate isomerase/epimerase|nr:sugar phosphate isomerase/epimerase family protein [Bryobacteraceae bacterium]